jgi:hypothetical protein
MVPPGCALFWHHFAAKESKHNLNLGHSQSVLRVEGDALAKILRVDPLPAFYSKYSRDWVDELKRIATETGFMGGASKSYQHKSFTRTACAASFTELRSPQTTFLPSAAQCEAILYGAASLDPNINPSYPEGPYERVTALFRQQCKGRALFTTRGDIPGLGPKSARVGDHVTVLLGCDHVMILRWVKSNQYKVI